MGFLFMGKIESEKPTVTYIIALYCRKKHMGSVLCDDCEQLNNYASERLIKC